MVVKIFLKRTVRTQQLQCAVRLFFPLFSAWFYFLQFMLQACERNYYPSCLNLGLLGRAWLLYIITSFNMMYTVLLSSHDCWCWEHDCFATWALGSIFVLYQWKPLILYAPYPLQKETRNYSSRDFAEVSNVVQCCGSEIRCFCDPCIRIRDPGWKKIRILHPRWTSWIIFLRA